MELYFTGEEGLYFLFRTARAEQQLPWIPRASGHAALRGFLGPIFILNTL